MNKLVIENLELNFYHQKLDNGLDIYVCQNENVKGFYVNFVTKFGSNDISFFSNKQNKIITVPPGIAHFLEHKLFETEDGVDPFTLYSELGLDCNANTNSFKTAYLFSGTNEFEKGLNILLNFVQKPYFTDQNVIKEQGIISEEINMYLDDPYTRIYEQSKYNLFINDPAKHTIAGTVDDIMKITKEDLYECYDTFYHPSNMFIIVTGNVNPEEAFNIVQENQVKKTFSKINIIERNEFKEPDEVAEEKEIIKMNVTTSKVAISYKINIDCFKKYSNYLFYTYLSYLLTLKFGSTSMWLENLKQDGIVTDSVVFSLDRVDNHVLISVLADTDKVLEFEKRVDAEIKMFGILEDDFKRTIKSTLSGLIYISDNYMSINNHYVYLLAKYGNLLVNEYDIIKNMSLKELESIYQKLSFDNKSKVIIASNRD